MTLARLIERARDMAAAAREGAGLDVDLIFELHRKLTPMNAVALADALAEFRPLFFEDPIQIDSIMLQGELAKRHRVPLANGERMNTIWEFRDLLAAGGPQYVRPDLGIAGGITGCRKIAALAESYHSALVSHNFLGPLLTAASIHARRRDPQLRHPGIPAARRVAAPRGRGLPDDAASARAATSWRPRRPASAWSSTTPCSIRRPSAYLPRNVTLRADGSPAMPSDSGSTS